MGGAPGLALGSSVSAQRLADYTIELAAAGEVPRWSIPQNLVWRRSARVSVERTANALSWPGLQPFERRLQLWLFNQHASELAALGEPGDRGQLFGAGAQPGAFSRLTAVERRAVEELRADATTGLPHYPEWKPRLTELDAATARVDAALAPVLAAAAAGDAPTYGAARQELGSAMAALRALVLRANERDSVGLDLFAARLLRAEVTLREAPQQGEPSGRLASVSAHATARRLLGERS